MSTNENTPISQHFWDWMQLYWHANRSFPPAHPDWGKKADLIHGKVPAAQLPSYVDDVLEFSSYTDFPQPGEKGKIYITTQDNKQFRWGGSAYVEINPDGKKTMINTLGLDESKYYPVTIQCSSNYPSTIKVYRNLESSMGIPSYSTHSNGFWCYYEFEVFGSGWGTALFKAICNYQDESWVKDNIKIIGYDQMAHSSNVVIYVRGGSKYLFDINSISVPILHTSPFTIYDETVQPIESRVWSGGILMNANTSDIQNAISGLNFNPADYVTSNTNQNITGKKRFDTAYDSYTPDGLFNSNAKPLSTITPGGKNLLIGYRDYGSGQYYPRIGFTSDTNWSLGAIGKNFTIGTDNDGSAQFSLTPSGSLKINGGEVFSTNNFDPDKKVSANNSQYSLEWDGFQNYLMRNSIPQGFLYHSGNLNPVTTDTSQTIVHQKTFNMGIGLTSGQKIQLAGYGDSAHYIRRFDDDYDGFGVSSGFAVKPYNNTSANLFAVNSFGTLSLLGGGRIDQFGNLIIQQDAGGGNATGIWWENMDNSHKIGGIGAYTVNEEFHNAYIGWGDAPWDQQNSLSIGENIFRYKDFQIYHEGNFDVNNYALKDGSNAIGTWVNASNGLGNNPYIPGKIKDASGNSTLAAATYGNIMGFINIYGSGQGNPTDDNWWYRLKMLHDNAAGYYSEIAVQMTGGINSLRYKRYENGSDGGWIEVWDRGNFNPELKSERENNAIGIGFNEGKIENPYMRHNSGNAYLATKNWTAGSFIPKTHPAANINPSQIDCWNNSIPQSAASEEVILEGNTFKIQPDEFSLEGNSSYDVGSKKKLVHVLFREGTELNIRELTRRQTLIVFNFSKDRINLNIKGLKPYTLFPEMQVTLYISDEREVLLYNETSFKKMQ